MHADAIDLAALEVTAWRAARFGPDLADAAGAGQEFSLDVQGDRLAGRSGCNQYMGTWAIEDGMLRIGPLASTMMWCDGLMELERSFLDALQSATTARLTDDRLILADAEGRATMELVPAEPG